MPTRPLRMDLQEQVDDKVTCAMKGHLLPEVRIDTITIPFALCGDADATDGHLEEAGLRLLQRVRAALPCDTRRCDPQCAGHHMPGLYGCPFWPRSVHITHGAHGLLPTRSL